jgi:Peptidase family M23/PQQ-like domain
MMHHRLLFFMLTLVVWAWLTLPQRPTNAQTINAPCGIVDAIDYPIDISDTLDEGYDDFALFRARFEGIHTGVDIGFRRRGEAVRSAARGRVTYSDIEGWDTEKGVVIVEHVFPDTSIVYSVYGHMEQSDNIFFPTVGSCVALGDVLGTIGWPSRGAPHLHYEIRNFLPNEGGPGYVTGNPLLEGWYHPLDFTLLWRARLNPAVQSYATFGEFPSLPPVVLDSGVVAVANSNVLVGYNPPSTELWRMTADGAITGVSALSGGRVVVRSRTGQVAQIQDGRYLAFWQIEGPDVPFVTIGDRFFFITAERGIAATDAQGQPLWQTAGRGTDQRILYFNTNGSEIAYITRANNITRCQIITQDGTIVADMELNRNHLITPARDGWIVVNDTSIMHLRGGNATPIGNLSAQLGISSQMTSDVLGNTYLYLSARGGTLRSFSPTGEVRWEVRYPTGGSFLPPLMSVGGGCLLYTLDETGTLNVFDTATGAVLNQLVIYAGGEQNNSPRSRVLRANQDDFVLAGGGFVSMLAIDGRRLGEAAISNCLLG